jgi:hypothetical protein
MHIQGIALQFGKEKITAEIPESPGISAGKKEYKDGEKKQGQDRA